MIKYRFTNAKHPYKYRTYTLAEIKADWELAKEEGWLDDSLHNASWDLYLFWAIRNKIIIREDD